MISKSFLRKVIVFSLIGALNTIIDFGIFNFLIYSFGLPYSWSYPLFKGISFLIACINSYIMNARFAFKSKASNNVTSFARFFVVTLCGMLINIIIATFLFKLTVSIEAPNYVKINGPVVIATFVSVVWNFVFYNYVIFRKKN